MIVAHLFLVWAVIFGAVGCVCSCWEEDKPMPVELIFIVGNVCGAVVGMALSG